MDELNKSYAQSEIEVAFIDKMVDHVQIDTIKRCIAAKTVTQTIRVKRRPSPFAVAAAVNPQLLPAVMRYYTKEVEVPAPGSDEVPVSFPAEFPVHVKPEGKILNGATIKANSEKCMWGYQATLCYEIGKGINSEIKIYVEHKYLPDIQKKYAVAKKSMEIVLPKVKLLNAQVATLEEEISKLSGDLFRCETKIAQLRDTLNDRHTNSAKLCQFLETNHNLYSTIVDVVRYFHLDVTDQNVSNFVQYFSSEKPSEMVSQLVKPEFLATSVAGDEAQDVELVQSPRRKSRPYSPPQPKGSLSENGNTSPGTIAISVKRREHHQFYRSHEMDNPRSNNGLKFFDSLSSVKERVAKFNSIENKPK